MNSRRLHPPQQWRSETDYVLKDHLGSLDRSDGTQMARAPLDERAATRMVKKP
jgi:hypothetical protein